MGAGNIGQLPVSTNALLAALRGRSFHTVLADPPWHFDNRTGKVAPEHRRLSRYPTMTLREIKALPVAQIVAEPAHLCMWAPNALLPEGIEVLRAWGFHYERFPKRATAFAAETPPAREVLAESRTLKGGGAAGVATVGAGGVEVAQQVLTETEGAILPLVPYLDTLRWLFIAVALGGIAVAIFARLDDWKRGRR
jgi:MT-A70